jgi:hypothetical protein
MSALRTPDQPGAPLMKQELIWLFWKKTFPKHQQKDWPGLVRSLEVFRQNRQLTSWSVKTEGTILAGNLVLPSSGKWSTYSYRNDENHDQVHDESFWHVEIKKAETLSPKPVHEWPEFLEAMKVIEQNKN